MPEESPLEIRRDDQDERSVPSAARAHRVSGETVIEGGVTNGRSHSHTTFPVKRSKDGWVGKGRFRGLWSIDDSTNENSTSSRDAIEIRLSGSRGGTFQNRS